MIGVQCAESKRCAFEGNRDLAFARFEHLNFSGPFSSIYSASKFRDLEGVERKALNKIWRSETQIFSEAVFIPCVSCVSSRCLLFI